MIDRLFYVLKVVALLGGIFTIVLLVCMVAVLVVLAVKNVYDEIKLDREWKKKVRQ